MTTPRTAANCAYPNDHEAAHDHADCIDALEQEEYDARPHQEMQPMIDYLETRYDDYAAAEWDDPYQD